MSETALGWYAIGAVALTLGVTIGGGLAAGLIALGASGTGLGVIIVWGERDRG